MFIYIYICVCVCVCFFTNNICTSGLKLACPRHVACSLCVCAGFGFHFVYAVVCLCACSDMVMHVGLSHFGCHVFFLPHMYPYPNYSFTTPGSSCFFSNLCMYMVFAMNEPLQAGSLCRLGAFAGCHNLLSKLFLKSTMWALFRPGFCASLKQD